MRLFFIFFALAVVLGFGFVATSSYMYRTPATAEAKAIVIPPHMGTREILAQLHDEGILPPPVMVMLPLVMSGAHHSLKAGEYEIDAGMTPAQILGKIARGEIVVHKLTVPEGWTSFQVRALIEAEPLLTGELPPYIEEGSVFPDTVHFTRDEPRAEVLARMQRRQQEVLAEAWAGKADGLPLTSPEDALVLASVIEKETGVEGERALVAGVFVNRLKIGMALQSDPTVAYGIMAAQGGKPLGRALTSADLRHDTLYNSYTRTGLPPTPICNPGRKAIEAALNPAQTDALYFVATGQGGHNFSATLNEHNRNVGQYRKRKR